MSSFPKVSIIIPIYNVEKYIRQCLDSVVNQTYKNIEIICVNDCTPDKSFEIVKEYAANDDRFVLIEQEKNQGLGVARNTALNIAAGKYVLFVDSDDWIDKNLITKCYEYIKQQDYNFIEFSSTTTDENGNILKKMPSFLDNHEGESYINNPEYIFFDFCAVWNKFYSLDFIKKNNILNSTARICEDFVFTVKTKILSQNHLIIDDILYFYRQQNNSITHTKTVKTLHIFKAIEDVIDSFKAMNVYEKYINCYQNFLVIVLASVFKNLVPNVQQHIFKSLTRQYLAEEKYSFFLKEIYKKKKKSFIEKLFSVTNSIDKKHKIILILGIKIKIKRKNNNHIFLVENGIKREVTKIKGIQFHFEGNNATVEIGANPCPKFEHVQIFCREGALVEIKSSQYYIRNTILYIIADNSKLFIDKNFSCEGMIICNCNESNLSVKIGKDCMFSYGITIRPNDGHSIYDNNTNIILNKPDINSVVIGNHVWVGLNSTILKNTKISDNSIVGAGTIVNKKFEDENVIIAGVPAKIIKKNVNWNRYDTEQFEYIKDLRSVTDE